MEEEEMSKALLKIEREAIRLPAKDREALAERLMRSSHSPHPPSSLRRTASSAFAKATADSAFALGEPAPL
jgi:hypothetical protein